VRLLINFEASTDLPYATFAAYAAYAATRAADRRRG
jgi:hypothetical protein